MALHLRQRTQLAAAGVFAAAVLVLTVQLLSPSPIVVSLGTEETTQLGEYFTYSDVTVLVVSAVATGASGTYLLSAIMRSEGDATEGDRRKTTVGADESVPTVSNAPAGRSDKSAENGPSRTGDSTMVSTRSRPDGSASSPDRDLRDQWEDRLESLRNSERTIYSLLIDADGELPQRELVRETELSKATVSRTLDALEHKALAERERRGMGNVVYLLQPPAGAAPAGE